MIANTWAELSAYSIPELAAVLASLAYIFLASRNSRLCWPPAFLGSMIFIAVMWQHGLLMDALLNAYYAAMAVYGWTVWQALDEAATDNEAGATIRSLRLRTHALAASSIILLSLLSGSWLAHNTSASFPYLDSITTWASLYATWLLAQRVLENWLYWIAINCLSIYLYINKALFFTTLLFIVYNLMAIYAFANWRAIKRKATRKLEAGKPPGYSSSADHAQHLEAPG